MRSLYSEVALRSLLRSLSPPMLLAVMDVLAARCAGANGMSIALQSGAAAGKESGRTVGQHHVWVVALYLPGHPYL